MSIGDRVSQGKVLLTMEQAGSSSEDSPDGAPESQASAAASDGAPNEAAAPDAVGTALEAEPPTDEEPEPPSDAEPEPPSDAEPADSDGAVYASPSVERLKELVLGTAKQLKPGFSITSPSSENSIPLLRILPMFSRRLDTTAGCGTATDSRRSCVFLT